MAATQAYIESVITRLEAWRENSFHTDRELSDAVLIADGWRVDKDPEFEGGVCWSCPSPSGAGRFCTGEKYRPHPVQRTDAAFAVIPYGYSYHIHYEHDQKRVIAQVYKGSDSTKIYEGISCELNIAVLIAALKALLDEVPRADALSINEPKASGCHA